MSTRLLRYSECSGGFRVSTSSKAYKASFCVFDESVLSVKCLVKYVEGKRSFLGFRVAINQAVVKTGSLHVQAIAIHLLLLVYSGLIKRGRTS